MIAMHSRCPALIAACALSLLAAGCPSEPVSGQTGGDLGAGIDTTADTAVGDDPGSSYEDVPSFEDVPPPGDAGCPPPFAGPAQVCPGQCGNGVRDQCDVCEPWYGPGVPFVPDGGSMPPPWDAGPSCYTVTEPCDGDDMPPGIDCAELGYAGGSVVCGETCHPDMRDCDICDPAAGWAACERLAVGAQRPLSLSLAARGEEVVVAWVAGSSPETNEGRARLARVRADDLEILAESSCFPIAAAYRVALAATPDGYLLAVDHAAGITLIALDPSAQPLDDGRLIPGAWAPFFAPRPDGGPLLTWAEGSRVMGALLGGDGSEAWQVELFDQTTGPEYGSAVSIGDAFLVAQRAAGVEVVRLELDGTVSATVAPGTSSTEYPMLAWSGVDVRLSWADFGATAQLMWARLDANGTILAGPVTVGTVPQYFNYGPMVTDGQDTLLITGTYTGGTGLGGQLDLLRLDEAGGALLGPVRLNVDPNPLRDWRIVRSGDSAIIGWITTDNPGGIGLGRLAP